MFEQSLSSPAVDLDMDKSRGGSDPAMSNVDADFMANQENAWIGGNGNDNNGGGSGSSNGFNSDNNSNEGGIQTPEMTAGKLYF